MPIKALIDIAKKVQKYPIKILNGESLAIDGFWFIKCNFINMTQTDFKNLDSYLESQLENFINMSKNVDIKWIWDGLNYTGTNKPISKRNIYKNSVWSMDLEFMVPKINEILKRNNIAVIRAPYSAMAQCIYYHTKRVVLNIYTKSDAFLYSQTTKIIISFDLKEQKYQWIERSWCEKHFNVRKNIWTMFAITSGCELCPTIPSLADNYNSSKLLDKLKNMSDGTFESELESNPDYKLQFENAMLNLKYHPIMTMEGRVESIDTENVPVDLYEIFGIKLPEYFYQQLFMCEISPLLLNEMIYTNKIECSDFRKNLVLKIKKILFEDYKKRNNGSEQQNDFIVGKESPNGQNQNGGDERENPNDHDKEKGGGSDQQENDVNDFSGVKSDLNLFKKVFKVGNVNSLIEVIAKDYELYYFYRGDIIRNILVKGDGDGNITDEIIDVYRDILVYINFMDIEKIIVKKYYSVLVSSEGIDCLKETNFSDLLDK